MRQRPHSQSKKMFKSTVFVFSNLLLLFTSKYALNFAQYDLTKSN